MHKIDIITLVYIFLLVAYLLRGAWLRWCFLCVWHFLFAVLRGDRVVSWSVGSSEHCDFGSCGRRAFRMVFLFDDEDLAVSDDGVKQLVLARGRY